MFSANAGEVTVSGSAKATYNATSGTNVDNTIGISNVLSVTASGEMDNNYTWSYQHGYGSRWNNRQWYKSK